MAVKENETICNKPRPHYRKPKYHGWRDEVFWAQWYNLCFIGFLSSSTNVKADTQVLSILSDFSPMDLTFPTHSNTIPARSFSTYTPLLPPLYPLINYCPHSMVCLKKIPFQEQTSCSRWTLNWKLDIPYSSVTWPPHRVRKWARNKWKDKIYWTHIVLYWMITFLAEID